MADVSAVDFDLDAWIQGVRATERSVEIYQRGDLVAVAEDLLRRYDVAQKIPADQRGINDETPDSLLAQIEEAQQELERTRAVITVRALSPEQVENAVKDAKGEDKDKPDLTAHQLAAAIVRVEVGGRVATAMTPAQVKALRDRVGNVQVLRVVRALEAAMSEEPNIQAPSSRRR